MRPSGKLCLALTFMLALLLLQLPATGSKPVPFTYYQRLIFIRVAVNNTDSLLFLFDTGANRSAIDEKAAGRLKLATVRRDTIEGTAGHTTAPLVRIRSLTAGGARTGQMLLTSYDLSGSLAPPGQQLDGILGTDFLRHFAVTVNFGTRQLCLTPAVEDTLARSMAIDLDNGIPRLEVRIGGDIYSWLRYDSGSSLFDTQDIYLNTTSQVLRLLAQLYPHLRPVMQLSGTGVGGSVTLPVYRTGNIKLAGIDIDSAFLIIQPETGYFGRPDAAGFFGNNLAERFGILTIDFPKSKMYIANSRL